MAEGTEVMKIIDGLVSAAPHKSRDRRRTANCSRWRTEEHLEQMLRDPRALLRMHRAAHLAT